MWKQIERGFVYSGDERRQHSLQATGQRSAERQDLGSWLVYRHYSVQADGSQWEGGETRRFLRLFLLDLADQIQHSTFLLQSAWQTYEFVLLAERLSRRHHKPPHCPAADQIR